MTRSPEFRTRLHRVRLKSPVTPDNAYVASEAIRDLMALHGCYLERDRTVGGFAYLARYE